MVRSAPHAAPSTPAICRRGAPWHPPGPAGLRRAARRRRRRRRRRHPGALAADDEAVAIAAAGQTVGEGRGYGPPGTTSPSLSGPRPSGPTWPAWTLRDAVLTWTRRDAAAAAAAATALPRGHRGMHRWVLIIATRRPRHGIIGTRTPDGRRHPGAAPRLNAATDPVGQVRAIGAEREGAAAAVEKACGGTRARGGSERGKPPRGRRWPKGSHFGSSTW